MNRDPLAKMGTPLLGLRAVATALALVFCGFNCVMAYLVTWVTEALMLWDGQFSAIVYFIMEISTAWFILSLALPVLVLIVAFTSRETRRALVGLLAIMIAMLIQASLSFDTLLEFPKTRMGPYGTRTHGILYQWVVGDDLSPTVNIVHFGLESVALAIALYLFLRYISGKDRPGLPL